MINEGYVKYHCNWIDTRSISPEQLTEINYWRDQLHGLGLIGEYENGIGFGNISIRSQDKPGQFIISGTHTGGISCLTEQHYTTITDFDWEKNFVTCVGPIQASSETLTHAAIYVADPAINAVIHVHNLALWESLKYQVPTTDPSCAYGTPEMAKEIIRLCQETHLKETKIIVMAGHKEGIITLGNNLSEAGNILLKYYQEIISL